MSKFTGIDQIVSKGGISNDAMQVVLQAEAAHNHTRDQIEMIISSKCKGIELGEGGVKLEPGTDLHKGFIVGLRVALSLIGEFPLKVTDADEGE